VTRKRVAQSTYCQFWFWPTIIK